MKTSVIFSHLHLFQWIAQWGTNMCGESSYGWSSYCKHVSVERGKKRTHNQVPCQTARETSWLFLLPLVCFLVTWITYFSSDCQKILDLSALPWLREWCNGWGIHWDEKAYSIWEPSPYWGSKKIPNLCYLDRIMRGYLTFFTSLPGLSCIVLNSPESMKSFSMYSLQRALKKKKLCTLTEL